jgi:hypothetical protein
VEPQDTLCKRVADGARKTGWVGTVDQDEVPSGWCDTEDVHIYIYIDQGPGEPDRRTDWV